MNIKNVNKQKGFTLIELIIVIIILGILAVTAAPKFLDIQDDAQISAMSGIAGAVRSASQIAHSAALIDSDGSIDLEGVAYDTTDTYLDADEICEAIGLLDANLTAGATDSTDGAYVCFYEATGGNDSGGRATIYPDDYQGPDATTQGNCYIRYDDATGTTAVNPVIEVVLTCNDFGAA